MKRINITEYPICNNIRLDSDYPGEEQRELTIDYLVFADGNMAFVEKAEGR